MGMVDEPQLSASRDTGDGEDVGGEGDVRRSVSAIATQDAQPIAAAEATIPPILHPFPCPSAAVNVGRDVIHRAEPPARVRTPRDNDRNTDIFVCVSCACLTRARCVTLRSQR